MPKEFFNYASDLSECDLLIVMGTSLKVQPFGGLVDYVKKDCPRLLINRDLVGEWQDHEDDPDNNYRDVAYLGSCDDGCIEMAELFGWKDELLLMIENDKIRLDKIKN